ncbi:histidine kinase [Brevundimonas sp. LM2]|uniref:PAS domain-containing sensor histidine kinase n=1 Tax=Brevundimonas sp. LM2 TaxID=1938605 RepID=UPI0009840149|nr:PAS domain-containing protein [Brevundimonas sp. LM2]AQR60629.1 histidine kinase [Brevundimonas sp. LM2]
MFLEGEVDWVLVLGGLATVTSLLAIAAVVFGLANRSRHVSAADELNAVSKAREAAETRLYETLNAIPVALVQTDRGGKFVFANRAAHQLMGRRDAELIGLRFHSATWGITYPDGRPVPPDLLPSARALRGQTVKGFQHILANPATRRKMLVSVTAMPIEDARGQITGSTAAIVETEGLTTPEVTPVEPEMTAPDPNDLTRRVFEAAASALVVVAANGVVREANAAALALIGQADDVVGRDFADQFLREDERVEGRQTLRAALNASPGEADDIRSQQGGASGLRWRVLPLARPGEVADALLLAAEPLAELSVEMVAAEPPTPEAEDEPEARVDPTLEAASAPAVDLDSAAREAELTQTLDQVRADLLAARADAAAAEARARAEVAERDQAAQRLESVGRLTGGVAQDFNALLAVMTSALDMMLKTAENPSRVRRLGQAALVAGQRGEALTRRLAAFSQGEDARGQVLDAGVLLRGMEARLRAVAGAGVDLMIEAPSRDMAVRLDPVAFEATVIALVRNGSEAMQGAGALAVRLDPDVEGAVRLIVRDTGPGLDAATAQRALEPFFTTRPGADGLGLAQAHGFARQWGGTLSLTGREGEGAEAVLTLPTVVAAPRRSDSAA